MYRGLASAARQLLGEQVEEWPLFAKRREAVANSRLRSISLGPADSVLVMFNPDRIKSVEADVSPEVIASRPCFLCEAGRDPLQRSLSVGSNYTLQVNPYPIFTEHFTVTYREHIPQCLKGHEREFVDIMGGLEEMGVFYNGPQCGASAPDHLHFHAFGEVMRLPALLMYREWPSRPYMEGVSCLDVDNRSVLLIETGSAGKAAESLARVMEHLPVKEKEYEPRVNVVGTYSRDSDAGRYTILVFPREALRPSCYYEKESEKRHIISPATVEMGGLMITVTPHDFETLNADDVRKIYKECAWQGLRKE